jgi:hypothetical protein
MLIVALVGAHPAPALATAPEPEATEARWRRRLPGRRETEPTPA